MENQKPPFNNSLYVLLLVPLISLGIGWTIFMNYSSYVIPGIFILISLGALGYLYQSQVNYIQTYFNKNVVFQIVILLAALIIPTIAVLAGDYIGAFEYNDEPYGLVSDSITGFIVGSLLTTICVISICISNALTIRTNASNDALKIVGKIFYVIGYIMIAVVAFFVYSLSYTLHDPSTE